MNAPILKNIKNNLNSITNGSEETEAILSKANIDFSIRAEKLDIEQILRLSDVYFEFYSQEK